MTMYYTLIPAKRARVDRPAPEPKDEVLPAFTSPRSIEVSDLADRWGEHDDIERLIDGRMALVQVSPVSTAESVLLDGGGTEFTASNGWIVEAILSLDLILGPEAQRIRQIASTPMGVNQESGYADEVDTIRETDEEDLDDLVEHAKAALDAAGVDGYFWQFQVSCTRGYEVIALAASDLTTEGGDWNARAQRQLLRPWAQSVRWPLAA